MNQTNPDEYHNEIVDILSEIKILTGALLYSDSREVALQVEVIKKLLISHPVFSKLTVKEIKHAFYLNNQGAYGEVYKHYNRELNGEFVGSVLLGYVALKRKIHTAALPKMYEMLKRKPESPKLRVTNAYMEQVIQMDYDNYRNGDVDIIFYPTRQYYYLRKCRIINYRGKQSWWKWYYYAMDLRIAFANAKHITTADREKARQLKALYDKYEETQIIPIHEHLTIVQHMQIQRYLYMLECMKIKGINKIFEEVEHEKPHERH